ncbi:P-loop containing nucleoside triphosphate hydrolase protein [Lentithecium fluviatile CBS 122367]|uniref:P-loop containing nucleoside triphosphate hydrolase protein n=1 Tax=Lentithecium fluviatile CBS 122367 TaxID=1168545 RepID=A0A6G1JAM4_9PLEO|nr:P-loop containing nucleoside triphosphate hydrolase protein [Lentithecium fluviatile CBS 122367]
MAFVGRQQMAKPRLNDQDIRHVTQSSLRETIGIVRQEQSFYNENTILETVRFARLDATDEEVYDACRNAAIHYQIMASPSGYHSQIGCGIKFSGGVRQRLFIAQLSLRNPNIVDDFAKIFKEHTTLIVTHRLSTIQHADQIIALNKGRIIERGTHDELLSLEGRYYQLCHKKKRTAKLESALERVKSDTEGPILAQPVIDLSDNKSDSSSIAKILQVDGASSSKAVAISWSDTPESTVRNRIRSLKDKFGGARKRDEDSDLEVDEGEEDLSPIRVLSPWVTDTNPLRSPPRRTIYIWKHSRDVKVSSISSPLSSPTGVATQEPLAFWPASTQSGIPVSLTPLSSPTRLRQDSGFQGHSVLPQSPGREASAVIQSWWMRMSMSPLHFIRLVPRLAASGE